MTDNPDANTPSGTKNDTKTNPVADKPENQPTPAVSRGKSYEENPLSQQEIEQAIQAVPLKNYSDYEITIESKDHYADALFSDEQELDKALTTTQETEAIQTAAQALKKSPSEPTRPVNKVDFTAFISDDTRPAQQQPDQETPARTNICNNQLNGSPARKTISMGETALAFADQLQAIATEIEKEQEHNAGPAVDSEPTPAISSEVSKNRQSGKFASIADKLKAKSKEFSQKGKARLDKSKAEFDEYLGRTLPERTFNLDFILPTIKAKKISDEVVTEKNIEQIFNAKNKTTGPIVARAEQALSIINKNPLSNSKRNSLLDAFSEPLSERLKSLIAMYERKPCNFDDEKRSSLCDNALNALKHIITGYKTSYADLYESANVIYGPQRKLACQLAFNIIDWLTLEQLVCIALHRPLPANSVKTANKIVYALSLYEPETINKQYYSLAINRDTTINDLFIRYQVAATLPLTGISSRQHKTLHKYLELHYHLVKLLPFELIHRIDELQPGQQLIEVSNDSNKRGQLLSENTQKTLAQIPLKPLYLQTQNLFNRIKADYIECLKLRINDRNKHSSPALAELNITQCLLLLSALNQSIRNLEINYNPPIYSTYNPIQLKAYSHLENCISFSKYHHALQLKGPIKKGAPTDNLPPIPPSSKCKWLCAFEDEKTIQLQAIEHRLGISIDINQLVIFSKTPDEGEDSPESEAKDENAGSVSPVEKNLITRITKIERSPGGKIQITANIISRQFTHIAIGVTESQSEAFMTAENGKRLLITDANQRFASNAFLQITLPDNQQFSATIDGLTAVADDSQTYQLI